MLQVFDYWRRSELEDNLAKLYTLNFETKGRMVLLCSCKAFLLNGIQVIDDFVVKVNEECVMKEITAVLGMICILFVERCKNIFAIESSESLF